MTLLDDFKKFVTDEQASGAYSNWARDNHGPKNDPNYSITNPKPGTEVALWYAFRDAIFAGHRPAVPTMLTAYGKGLIDAGVLYLNATAPPPLKVSISGTPQVGKTLTAVVS